MKINPNQKRRLVWQTVLIALSFVIFCVAALTIFRVKNETSRSLAALRSRADQEKNIPFTKTVRPIINNQQIRFWQNTNNVRSAARFRGFVFAATDGGLLQLSGDGKFLRHWTVLDGLTESDLTCLAVFNDRLFIGTNSTGLLAFDGTSFDNYTWRDRAAKSVNALLADDGRLLIGTFAGGLLEFDGSRFREIKTQNQSLIAVNFLAKDNQKLFVGTFDNGLWLSEAGRWRHFTTAEGLLSNRIVGVVASGAQIFVATDMGVVAVANLSEQTGVKVFSRTAVLPTLSSLVKNVTEIFAIRDDGKMFALVGERAKTFLPVRSVADSTDLMSARLSVSGDDFWLIGDGGLFRRENGLFVQFGDSKSENSLASNIISALAVDGENKIWAGTFRQGIDVFSSDGRKLKHFESENTREINFILPEKESVWAATAAGAAKFDKSLAVTNFAKSEGLLSNSVAHISVEEDKSQRFFATSRGLSWQTASGWRGLTTVNGLPSNNVYTTLAHKNSLFVGTLSGLAEVQQGRVVRTFADANSALAQNWVTALCAADERVFVGTYGGGIFELTPAGEVRAFAHETGKFVVNPNAMFSDDERLYAGTLEGVRVLNLSEQKWTHLTEELPAQTVLSVTGDGENIYFGTTGGIAKINKNYFRAIGK